LLDTCSENKKQLRCSTRKKDALIRTYSAANNDTSQLLGAADFFVDLSRNVVSLLDPLQLGDQVLIKTREKVGAQWLK
jgi:hypothetical protein